MEAKLSYKCIEKHLLRLRVGGYYQIDPQSPRLQRRLHDIYMRVTLIWIIVYTTQQVIKVFEVQYDMEKVMGTLFLFLTHTDSIYKQIVLWIKADKVEELLDIMKGPLFNQEEPDHKKFLLQASYTSTLLLHIDNGMALFTCFLWVLLPFVLHLQGKPVEFAIWLPFDVNTNPTFYLVIMYVWFTTSWLALCNTTIDVMVSFLFGQCKTQLTILRNDLLNLTKRSEEEHIITGEPCSDIISRRFRKILQHHVQIVQSEFNKSQEKFLQVDDVTKINLPLRTVAKSNCNKENFVRKVEDIFSIAVAYQFLVSGWIICTSMYPASLQFLSMVLYMFCMLMQISMYCYYGNEVTIESENLADSAYCMNWLDTSLTHRRHMILFMERIKKPIQPLAGGLIPLSNYTFVSIVKSSYSFYALLKNTSK